LLLLKIYNLEFKQLMLFVIGH